MQDGVVKFFTRNSNNYTRIYGPKISAHIKECVDAQACILDGEMVVWDTLKQQVAPFGLNKHIAIKDDLNPNFEEKKKPEDDSFLNLQICYKIFDILYIKAHGDDQEEINLMGARLTDRKIVLSKILREIPGLIELVPHKLCTSVDEVFEEFNQSIYKNEEGIMIKRAESAYKPNERA